MVPKGSIYRNILTRTTNLLITRTDISTTAAPRCGCFGFVISETHCNPKPSNRHHPPWAAPCSMLLCKNRKKERTKVKNRTMPRSFAKNSLCISRKQRKRNGAPLVNLSVEKLLRDCVIKLPSCSDSCTNVNIEC